MRGNQGTIWGGWCVSLVFAWSCAGSTGPEAVAGPAEVARAERERLALTVEPLASCEDAAASLRAALEADVHARMDEALRSFLTSDAAGCERATRDAELKGVPFASDAPATSNEADAVKADHAFIYKLDSDGSRPTNVLRILAVQPAAQTRQIAQVSLPGQPSKLFVVGDRALIYSRIPAPTSPCTSCVPVGGSTALLLYDLTDRAAPTLLRRVDVRGELTAARQIGQRVYSVISAAPLDLGLSYAPTQLDACFPSTPRLDDASALQAFEQLRAKNLAKIRALDFAPAVPVAPDGGEVSACRLYHAQDHGTAVTSLLSFDLSLDAAPELTSFQTQRSQAYLSDHSLYLAVDQVHTLHEHVSAVHAFGLSGTAAEHRGSGFVEGRVIDASSMDEWQDQLRIATTTDFHFGHPAAQNLLSVLALRDGRLQRLSQLPDILPGQDVRSVRFEGAHAFLTSFNAIDPLYAFELSDPEHPAQLPELTTAGFSVFQRMLDDRHLLSLGYNAVASCQFACFDSLVLQISDLEDPGSPVRRYEVPFSSAASLMGAFRYAHTIQFANDRLAVPVSQCAVRRAGRSPFDLTFSGVIMYGVDPQAGLEELGRFGSLPASAEDAESLCEDWNASAQPEFERCVLMDGYVYAFTPERLHVQDEKALGADVASVAMPAR